MYDVDITFACTYLSMKSISSFGLVTSDT